LAGRTVRPKRHLLGNNGLVEFPKTAVNLVVGFERWLQRGFPHHICLVEGKNSDRLVALADALGVNVLPNYGL